MICSQQNSGPVYFLPNHESESIFYGNEKIILYIATIVKLREPINLNGRTQRWKKGNKIDLFFYPDTR
jgi:hypothetical protein